MNEITFNSLPNELIQYIINYLPDPMNLYFSCTKLLNFVQMDINLVFCFACAYGNLQVVKYLLVKEPDLIKNNYAIKWACEKGQIEVVKYLINLGVDIHIDNDKCIQWAAESGHLEMVKYLVKQNCDMEK